MSRIETALLDIGNIDSLAARDTPIHRLDPRAKVLAAFIFIVAVVSFDKYDLSGLMPFFLYPIVLIGLGDVPLSYLLKRLVLAIPFVLFVAIFNPLLDRAPLMRLGGVEISGGWVSFASILIRFALTLSAALILIASTGLNSVCAALEKMGVPRVFVTQVLFLYRYLFVLMDEALRMVRAHALRSFGRRLRFRVFGSLVGQLLLRTLDRAQRIHTAMRCRGFDGQMRPIRSMKLRPADVAFVLAWSAFFVFSRWHNLPQLLGERVMGLAS